ncbi:MAG: PEP-CTERM sorting domain-containing protein, partial [Akkermansia sp.]
HGEVGDGAESRRRNPRTKSTERAKDGKVTRGAVKQRTRNTIMKKTFVLGALLLSSVASAETYTWVGKGTDSQWFTLANWEDSSGNTPASLPAYDSDSKGDVYKIGNGATVTANSQSVFAQGGSFIIGDNVSMGGDWAIGATNMTIGKNFTWSATSGDGLKFAASGTSEVTNTLVLDSVYNPTSGASKLISTMCAGSSIDFKTEGQIVVGNNASGYDLGKGKALTLTAEVASASDEVQTRWLILGNNIYYRDVTNENKLVDYTASTLTTTVDGVTMTQYDLVKDTNAAWTLSGAEADLTEGAYRFVATSSGIGVQYYISVPEPTTATLSLLALAGLAARRRRH